MYHISYKSYKFIILERERVVWKQMQSYNRQDKFFAHAFPDLNLEFSGLTI